MLILDFLLENGGSSVKYRTKRDILKDDIHSDEMQFIQKEILCKYQVRKLLDNQHEDSWIGNELPIYPFGICGILYCMKQLTISQ